MFEAKKLFRVTWKGYRDCKVESEQEAIEQFIDYIENEDTDQYGRTWKDLIEVEELDE